MCRMFPIFSKITEFCNQSGITTIAETAAEAQRSAAHNDTDWSGYAMQESMLMKGKVR